MQDASSTALDGRTCTFYFVNTLYPLGIAIHAPIIFKYLISSKSAEPFSIKELLLVGFRILKDELTWDNITLDVKYLAGSFCLRRIESFVGKNLQNALVTPEEPRFRCDDFFRIFFCLFYLIVLQKKY